jgi:hypothetical protein
MPMALASAVGVSRILGQEGTGIPAKGWHFPGIILVFCWQASNAILVACLHGGGSGGAAHYGQRRGHGESPVSIVVSDRMPSRCLPVDTW